MGIYDRDYARHEGYGRQYSMGGGFRGMPPAVKWLLIVNFVVYIIAALTKNGPGTLGYNIYMYGAVIPDSFVRAIQIWRLITYQFLHDPTQIFHLLFNLIVLYFMGPFLERAWGSKAFLKFYLLAGAAGGVVFTLLVGIGILSPGMMVGASGAIYGVVAAIAVMYPHMRVLLWGIIPMTMVRLVILIVIISLVNIAFVQNVGGEVAHLTGLAVGFFYVKYKPLLTRFRMERHKGAWEKKMEQQMNFQREVDRILDKVQREGINALSDREKEILQEATRREQEQGKTRL